MKSLHYHLTLLLLTLFLGRASAQYEGEWVGILQAPGLSLNMTIELSKQGDAWSGSLDIPVQMIQNMELGGLSIADGQIRFRLPEVPGNAHYDGQFVEDGLSIEGTFYQAGQKLVLNFKREDQEKRERIVAGLVEFEALVDSLMQKRNVPGMGIGIIQDGEILMSRGFGLRDVDENLDVDDRTLFAIGSTTKAMTAAGLAMLIDEGLLEWDTPVREYMPDFRMKDDFATAEMTALDLVTNRSGLPRHDLLWYGSDFSREELFSRIRHLDPTKSFRTTFQYQNLMFMSAGVLAERLTGTSWEEYTRQHILDPLEMTRSNFSVTQSMKDENAALPYIFMNDSLIEVPYRNLDAIGPAGSINSCIADMLKWVEFNLDDGKHNGTELITTGQMEVLHGSHMLMGTGLPNPKYPEYTPFSYGGGWFIYHNDGARVLQHGGGIDGFTAHVHLLPTAETGLVILANKGGAGLPSVLANHATDILLDREPKDWASRAFGADDSEETDEENDDGEKDNSEDLGRVADTAPSHPLTDYQGQYEHEAYSAVVIKLVDNKLTAEYNGFNMPLEHWHYDVFNAYIEQFGINWKFEFQSDASGSIQSLRIPVEPTLPPHLFAKSAPDLANDPTYLNKIVGAYEGTTGQVGTVSLEGKKLLLKLPGQPTYRLIPYKMDEFQIKDLEGYSLRFVFDEARENVEHVEYHQPNGIFIAKRKD